MESLFNTTLPSNVSESENLTTSLPPAMVVKENWSTVKENFYIAGMVMMLTFLLIGLFGNTITIITMATKSFANMTSRYILVALAVSDTTLILTQPFNKLYVRKLFGYDPRAISDFGCKLFFHIFKTGKMTSSWLIVILCFERFIAVVFPLKAKTIITKKTILILIALDYLFIGTFNGVWTFSSIIVDDTCKPDVTYPDTKNKYRDFLLAGSSFYSLIPMVVMVILTPVIVFKLVKQKRRRRTMSKSYSTNSKADADTLRISVMLIGVVVAYVTFVLPITVVHNLAFWRNISAFDTNTFEFFVLREVAQMLEQLNYSTNFMLYVLCSKRFRERAMELLKLDKCFSKSTDLAKSPESSKKTVPTDRNKKQSLDVHVADSTPQKTEHNRAQFSRNTAPDDVIIEASMCDGNSN